MGYQKRSWTEVTEVLIANEDVNDREKNKVVNCMVYIAVCIPLSIIEIRETYSTSRVSISHPIGLWFRPAAP